MELCKVKEDPECLKDSPTAPPGGVGTRCWRSAAASDVIGDVMSSEDSTVMELHTSRIISSSTSVVSVPSSIALQQFTAAAPDVASVVCSSASKAGSGCASQLFPPHLVYAGSTPAIDLPSDGQLRKLRRFLTTLHQFGLDVSEELADRVKQLILALVGGCISVDEFHSSLQEATNYPLRPFVVPFLHSHLPLLQREVLLQARTDKLGLRQYLRRHEYVVFDPSHVIHDPSEIFSSEAHDLRKRTLSDSCAEGSSERGGTRVFSPPAKRLVTDPVTVSPGCVTSPVSSVTNGSATGSGVPRDLSVRNPEEIKPEDRDEWKNIHVMLNCILSMVEKTRRALSILQQRCGPRTSDWTQSGPGSDLSGAATDTSDVQRHATDILTQTVRATEQRVAEIRRRAEEAVCEVKRQAVRDLHRAASAAESRASELLADERCRIESMLMEARKLGSDEVLTSASRQTIGAESCWNCGRKATETCSGCSAARYCGPFCQHKDWEQHRRRCTGELHTVRLTPDTR